MYELTRKRAREEEIQRRFPLQLSSFCPVWVSSFSGLYEESQFTGAVQPHVLDHAKRARDLVRMVGDTDVPVPSYTYHADSGAAHGPVVGGAGGGAGAAAAASAAMPPTPVPVPIPVPKKPVAHSTPPAAPTVFVHSTPPAAPGIPARPTFETPASPLPNTHQIAGCTAFIDRLSLFLQTCLDSAAPSAAAPVRSDVSASFADEAAMQALRSDLGRAFERLRAYQQAIATRFDGIVASVEEWCRLAETCMSTMSMWEVADQDGSMDPASRDALLRLLQRARAASSAAAAGASGASAVVTGGLFQDSVRDALGGGSRDGAALGSGVVGILRLNMVYADVAVRLATTGSSTASADAAGPSVGEWIKALLDGLAMMRMGLLQAEHGGQALLRDVKETFAIVRAAMGFVGSAAGGAGNDGCDGSDRGVPCSVEGISGTVAAGERESCSGDMLEDMVYLYRMLDVVL